MINKEKIKRFLACMSCAVGVYLLAETAGTSYALAFLTFFLCSLSYQFEDITDVVARGIPDLFNNVKSNIKNNFNKMHEELPAAIYEGMKQRREEDRKKNSQAEKLKKCVVKPGIIMDREHAIEVILEFIKNDISVQGFTLETMGNAPLTYSDKQLINIALNLIEMKLQSNDFNCPQCQSETGMKFPNACNPYCEDCGWPDENRTEAGGE